MRKRIISMLLVLVLCVGLFPVMVISAQAAVTFAGGVGTEGNPYQISTPAQLDAVRNDLSAHYILINDIDLSVWGNWEPIGTYDNSFEGTFDGNGKIIYNLYINKSVESVGTGLFGYARQASISNICLNGVNISCIGWHVGGLVGYNNSSIVNNCTITGELNVTGNYYVGGLAGYINNGGTLINNTVTGDISVNGVSWIGGLVGQTAVEGMITNNTVTGSVVVSSTANCVGGLAGSVTDNSTVMENLINGNVVINGVNWVGELVGSSGQISTVLLNTVKGKITVNGVVSRINFTTDRWHFKNQDTSIAYNIYTRLYGTVQGSIMYLKDSRHGEGGQCYGLAATTATINDKMPDVNSFGHSFLVNVGLSDTNTEVGMTAADFIKYGHLLQYSEVISQQLNNTANDLQRLYEAVRNFQIANGDPIVIGMYGDIGTNTNTGHAVYPLRIGKETSTSCEIIVNDSNSPLEERVITLAKEEGIFTSWSFDLYSFDSYVTTWGSTLPNGKINFSTPASLLYYVGYYYNQEYGDNTLIHNDSLLLSSDIDTFAVQSGSSAEYVTESYAGSDWLIPILPVSGTNELSGMYWVNSEETLTISGLAEPTNISLAGYGGSIDVRVPAEAIIHLDVSDAGGENAELILPENSDFSLSYTVENGEYLDTITILGKSVDTVKTARTERGVSFSGVHDVTITAEIEGKTTSKSFTDISDSDSWEIVIENISNSIEVTLVVVDNASKYTITATAGTGGTVTGSGTYDSGTSVTLTATPNSNYSFDGWYENNIKISGATATYTFVAASNRTIEARFVKESDEVTISLDPSSNKDFGSVVEGYTEPTAHSVTINNTGNVTIANISIELSGADANDFMLSKTTVTNLPAGDNDTFTVVPNVGLSAGNYSAVVTVTGLDNVERFNVNFEVIEATYTIEVSPRTDIDFGLATEGYIQPAAHFVTVTNTGNSSISDISIELSGTNSEAFVLSKTSIIDLAAGENDSFTVAPEIGLDAAEYSATVTVTSPDCTISFDVYFEVTDEPTLTIGIEPSYNKDFGSLPEGYTQPNAHEVIITNTSNASIADITISLSGADADVFTLSRTSVTDLGAGETDSFTAVPNEDLSIGTYIATVVVTAPDNSVSFNVSFEVTAVPSYTIELAPASDKNFGSATVGYNQPLAHNVTINNIGNSNIADITIALSGTNADNFTISQTSVSDLAAGENISFTVVPNMGLSVGTYSATVTVTAPDNTISFNVSFNVKAEIVTYTITATAGTGGSISPSGSISVAEGNSQTFTITADSDYVISDVKIDDISVGAISTYTFSNVTENHTISATFAKSDTVTTYTVTATAGKGGTISPSGYIKVAEGNSQTFKIKADSDYSISEVWVDGKNKGDISSYTFYDVAANHTIEAYFTKDSSSNSSSKITVYGPGSSSSSSGSILYYSDSSSSTGTTPVQFSDTGSHWANYYIENVAAKGWIIGYPDGAFKPDGSITRAELLTIVYRLTGGASFAGSYESSYNDVSSADWYAAAVSYCAGNGYLDGIFEGDSLLPNQAITRGEVAAILAKLKGYYDFSNTQSCFSDVNSNDIFAGSIEYLEGLGLITGYPDGTFHPNSSITRAEICTILFKGWIA